MEKKKIVKKTAKKQKLVLLPEVRNYVIQPNRITNAIYNYTLFQERIFTAVMYYLQEPITHSMKNLNYQQLELFTSSDKVRINIPLKDISRPEQYKDVKKAIKEMASIVLEIPYTTKEKKERIRITNLFSADIPAVADYSSFVSIDMEKVVASKLIEIDKDFTDKPINYTRYIYEIAQNAETKYTSRLYKIISSWKKKGAFIITLDQLKEHLGIINKYPSYSDFKRRVLLPAQAELYEKADCWFNCRAKDFEVRDGKTVTHLNFKVITPEFAQEDNKKTDYIRNILKDHFQFTDNDFLALRPILNNDDITRQQIINKIMQIAEHLSTHHDIIHKKEYALKSLMNEFIEQ
jgi:plasmid replication initiation protein